MQLFVIPLVIGLVCGTIAAVAWGLLWTVLIPWEAHSVFYTIVFIAAGFGGAVWSLKGILR